MNECIPKYEPGADVTAQVTQAGGVLGKRFVKISADKQGTEAVAPNTGGDDTSGGNIQVAYPAAGGPTVGVTGYDAAQNTKIKVVRGPGKVVPITCSIALGYGQEVEAAADGTAVPLGTSAGGKVRGKCWRSAAINTDALIELYV